MYNKFIYNKITRLLFRINLKFFNMKKRKKKDMRAIVITKRNPRKKNL